MCGIGLIIQCPAPCCLPLSWKKKDPNSTHERRDDAHEDKESITAEREGEALPTQEEEKKEIRLSSWKAPFASSTTTSSSSCVSSSWWVVPSCPVACDPHQASLLVEAREDEEEEKATPPLPSSLYDEKRHPSEVDCSAMRVSTTTSSTSSSSSSTPSTKAEWLKNIHRRGPNGIHSVVMPLCHPPSLSLTLPTKWWRRKRTKASEVVSHTKAAASSLQRPPSQSGVVIGIGSVLGLRGVAEAPVFQPFLIPDTFFQQQQEEKMKQDVTPSWIQSASSGTPPPLLAASGGAPQVSRRPPSLSCSPTLQTQDSTAHTTGTGTPLGFPADEEEDETPHSWHQNLPFPPSSPSSSGSFLLFNGELFGGALCPPAGQSDTAAVARRLAQLEDECWRATTTTTAIPPTAFDPSPTVDEGIAMPSPVCDGIPPAPPLKKATVHTAASMDHSIHGEVFHGMETSQRCFLQRVRQMWEQEAQGPYSFVYFASRLAMVVFGRDPLGRRSLLLHIRPLPSAMAMEEEGEKREKDQEGTREDLEGSPCDRIEVLLASVATRGGGRSTSVPPSAPIPSGPAAETMAAPVGMDPLTGAEETPCPSSSIVVPSPFSPTSDRHPAGALQQQRPTPPSSPPQEEEETHPSSQKEKRKAKTFTACPTGGTAPLASGKETAPKEGKKKRKARKTEEEDTEDEEEDGGDSNGKKGCGWTEVLVTGIFGFSLLSSRASSSSPPSPPPPSSSSRFSVAFLHAPWEATILPSVTSFFTAAAAASQSSLVSGSLPPSGHLMHPVSRGAMQGCLTAPQGAWPVASSSSSTPIFSSPRGSGTSNSGMDSFASIVRRAVLSSCPPPWCAPSCAASAPFSSILARQLEGLRSRLLALLEREEAEAEQCRAHPILESCSSSSLPTPPILPGKPKKQKGGAGGGPLVPPRPRLLSPRQEEILQYFSILSYLMALSTSVWKRVHSTTTTGVLSTTAERVGRRVSIMYPLEHGVGTSSGGGGGEVRKRRRFDDSGDVIMEEEGEEHRSAVRSGGTSRDGTRSPARYTTTSTEAGEARLAAATTPIGILFSGGVDCVVVAALTHFLLPPHIPIELINVAFGAHPEETPDRMATFEAMTELLQLSASTTGEGRPSSIPAREWRLVLVDVKEKPSAAGVSIPATCPSSSSVFLSCCSSSSASREQEASHILDLLWPKKRVMDVDIGTALWYAAKGVGRMQSLFPSPRVEHTVDDGVEHKKEKETDSVPHHAGKNKGGGGSQGQVSSFSPAVLPFLPSSRLVDRPRTSAEPLLSSSSSSPFILLRDILVAECYRRGAGPEVPVLLSTLGKEYAALLSEHFRSYGYASLGTFLDAASRPLGYERGGRKGKQEHKNKEEGEEVVVQEQEDPRPVIAFDASAGKSSKAVKLIREEDKAAGTSAAAAARQARMRTWYAPLPSSSSPRHLDSGPTLEDPSSSSSVSCSTAPPAGASFSLSYTCAAKVVLSGLGADETLGGYTRHRRQFQRRGVLGLLEELQRDFEHLWDRNLGRDDRIIMDSGREGRFPYLDEELLATLTRIMETNMRALRSVVEKHKKKEEKGTEGNEVPSAVMKTPFGWQHPAPGEQDKNSTEETPGKVERQLAMLDAAMAPLMDLVRPPGEGDKRVLRRLAKELGLHMVSTLQKRAIQFGSRAAAGHMAGTDVFVS